ncbi:MAG: cysteine hydrolase [Candidatus Tectomicrobia bacterium]|nr:cysteine hydrolase [Candidatus Tectomicrobia bacterium]
MMQPLLNTLDHTALLVIDMQNAYCHPQGGMAKGGKNINLMRQSIQPIVELIQLCRRQGIPILLSQQEHWGNADLTRRKHAIPSHLDRQKISIAERGTWDFELLDEIKAVLQPEDNVFVKHRMSCFFDTNLATRLRMLDVTQLIIGGVATNVCVESTIRDAYFRDFDIIVVPECVGGPWPELHANTLKNVEMLFGRLVSLADLYTAFGARVMV